MSCGGVYYVFTVRYLKTIGALRCRSVDRNTKTIVNSKLTFVNKLELLVYQLEHIPEHYDDSKFQSL